jgi:glyoxylase-like metal-dependent hydrolase (beta-lactamase superfamily II)
LRALALADDVIVVLSAVWQTTCVAVRAGEEGLVIDSPVYPDELAALPGVLGQAGFPVSGLLATHADWDHLLARLAFPGASLGVGEPSARRLEREAGAPQRGLRAFDQEHYVQRPEPLMLGGLQELPVPGRLELGPERELELYPAGGHTVDGTAFWIGWREALVCGDYLSPVEIPTISAGAGASAREYLATLERLAPLVARARHVIPGHGTPLAGERARALLGQDHAYVEGLLRDGDAPLPDGRRTPRQRELHAANVAASTAQR